MSELLIERWECTKCGSPCRIEIKYSNSKLPKEIAEQSRFRNRICICKEVLTAYENPTKSKGIG